ncbi:stalk domain-containing protein [Saccharibacillus alkalitolerans]|uniref:Copper amine oxidase n=1 Tax=Saccharibacillus alkalitolerans TaxID=2705290 RepID=A0ABX0EYT0_9BACL|nr:stalk domain-containing protein [Saccharibacillus alkalitolerans]NGZ73897.1 copper amine oxidase [Saccharibacillus alkalitolerans]
MTITSKKSLAAVLLSASLGLSVAATASAAETGLSIRDFTPNSLIKSDGSYWSWGGKTPVPNELRGIGAAEQAFFDGDIDYLIEKTDGSLLMLKPGSLAALQTYKPVQGLKNAAKIRFNGDALAIDDSGSVFVSGRGEENAYDYSVFSPVGGISDIVDAAGYTESSPSAYAPHWLLLKKDGTVWRDTGRLTGFKPVPNLTGVSSVGENAALKKDGTVWTLPTEYDKALPTSTPSAVKVQGLSGIRSLKTARYGGLLAIDLGGNLFYKGYTITGWSDGTSINDQGAPVRLTGVRNVEDAWVVERSLVVFTNDGSVYETSLNRAKLPANAKFRLLASGIEQVEAGSRHIIMQKKDGSLLGWGVNKNGDLGSGDYEFEHDTPVPVQRAISVSLNGKDVELGGGVITQKSQTFVPLRSVFEQLGAKISFVSSSKAVTVSRTANGKTTSIAIDTKTGATRVNGKAVQLEQAPFAVNGITYLPLRFISEQLGAKVSWVQAQDTVAITLE